MIVVDDKPTYEELEKLVNSEDEEIAEAAEEALYVASSAYDDDEEEGFDADDEKR